MVGPDGAMGSVGRPSNTGGALPRRLSKAGSSMVRRGTPPPPLHQTMWARVGRLEQDVLGNRSAFGHQNGVLGQTRTEAVQEVGSMEAMVTEGREKLRREEEQAEADQQAISHRMHRRFGIPGPASNALNLGDGAVRCSWGGAVAVAAASGALPPPCAQQGSQTPRQTPQTPRQMPLHSHGAQWNLQERCGFPGPVSPLTRREKAEQRWEVLFGNSCPLKPRTSRGVPNIGTSVHWQGLMVGAVWEPSRRTPRIEPVSAIITGPDATLRREIIMSNTKSARLKASERMEEDQEVMQDAL
mmetsp:Transcript_31292/g.89798  ORF Transcript_31292/g.89798 Transcript_31292/m.89798 type:complete len:299 (-) Transcript_31292:63-959(-)